MFLTRVTRQIRRLQAQGNRMATISRKEQRVIAGSVALSGLLGELPATKLLLDYDQEADVLYLSLQRPQKATKTVEFEDGAILLRYRGTTLVGITVLNVSKRR